MTSWDAMIPAVKGGQFDVGMDGITINDERKQQVDFSDPYMVSQQFMLVRADEDRFKTCGRVQGERQAADRVAGGDDELLHGGVRGAGRERAEPADQAVRDVRGGGAGAAGGRRGHGADGCGVVEGLRRRQPGQAEVSWTSRWAPRSSASSSRPSPTSSRPSTPAISQMKADGYLDYLNNRWFFLNNPNGEDVYKKLPDLKGRTVKAVTENAYTPLNFVDPKTGKAVGWEYDAIERDLPAAELQGGVGRDVVGCDDPGGEGRAVRRGDGRDHDQRRAQAAGGLLGPVHGVAAVHAGAGGRGPVQDARPSSRRTTSC